MTPAPKTPWHEPSVRAGEMLAEKACGSGSEIRLSRADLARWLGTAFELGCEFAAKQLRAGGAG